MRPRSGSDRAPGDIGWLLPTFDPLRETGELTSVGMVMLHLRLLNPPPAKGLLRQERTSGRGLSTEAT